MSVTIFNQNQDRNNQDQKTQEQTVPKPKNTEDAMQIPNQENTELNSSLDSSANDQAGASALSAEPDEKKLELQEENIKKVTNELPKTLKNKPRHEGKLSAYLVKPRRVAYNGQLREESIVLLLRQHPITQLNKLIMGAILLSFPVFLILTGWLSLLNFQFQLAIFIGWFLVLFGFGLEAFLSWYFRVFIVTNRRVIDVDFHSMVHKDITTAKLENIQDVNFITAGVLASLIDFGTVYLQTAGATAKIEFEKVPHPAEVVKILNEMIALKKRYLRS